MNSSDHQDYIENQERKHGEYRGDWGDEEDRGEWKQPLFARLEFKIFIGILIVGFLVWYPILSQLVKYWYGK